MSICKDTFARFVSLLAAFILPSLFQAASYEYHVMEVQDDSSAENRLDHSISCMSQRSALFVDPGRRGCGSSRRQSDPHQPDCSYRSITSVATDRSAFYRRVRRSEVAQ
jgi:hypothetical protein